MRSDRFRTEVVKITLESHGLESLSHESLSHESLSHESLNPESLSHELPSLASRGLESSGLEPLGIELQRDDFRSLVTRGLESDGFILSKLGGALMLWLIAAPLALGALPPPPAPPENPVTEAKRILGKILFWDEQLSSDNTVACGTCHTPEAAGADLRLARNPGTDGVVGTVDDILGSPGVVKADSLGKLIQDAVFGFNPQITRRSANPVVDALYIPEMFWDGRARSLFLDPQTGSVAIAAGGALENQAVGPIVSGVEMARQGRTWTEVAAKLELSEPLGNATNLPPDMAMLVASHPTYQQLFQSAFGDPSISAQRIAFAIATYERTLVADQTPWDRFTEGNPAALTPGQQAGWNFFRNSPCSVCHAPPLFTNNTFRNIGVRPPAEDTGRQEVTGLTADRGRFKVPTLRNAGRKATFMHNGGQPNLQAVIAFYRPNNPARSTDNLDPLLANGIPVPPNVQPALIDFLTNGLTDPRVAARTFPFDRPGLHAGDLPLLFLDPDRVTLRWPALQGVQSYVIYRGNLSDLGDSDHDGIPDLGYGSCVSGADPNPADTVFVDTQIPVPGNGFFYLKAVVDAQGVRGFGTTSSGTPRPLPPACP